MQDKILTGTIVCASAVALVDIQTVMGIILMCVQLGLIIWKTIEKVKKSKSPEEKIEAIEQAQKEISDKTKGGDK